MLTLLALAFMGGPASAEQQQYPTIKKGNKTHIIEIDPVTAQMLQDSMKAGKTIKVKTAYDYLKDDYEDSCSWHCRKQRRALEKKYGHKIDWAD